MERSQLEILDGVYRDTAPEAIPWHFDTPPELLVELVSDGTLKPCRAVDLGCGLGSASLFLASQGFSVTGVDGSPTAIARAGEHAAAAGLDVRFAALDLLGSLDELGGAFELALDWEVLHHILPEHREAYAGNVARLLGVGGQYLSLSFAEDDPWLAEQGKRRVTPLSTVLYFADQDELRALWEPHFEVLRLETVEVPGKRGPHRANLALLEKR